NNKPGNYVRTFVLNATTGAIGVPPGETPRNNCLLPAALVYDPVTNPTGTRCGDPDLAAAVWGTTENSLAPGRRRALQTGDNVGIQYGLKALRYGTGLLPANAAQVAAVTLSSLLTMDTWLSTLNVTAPKETLNSVRTQQQVIAAKPANAVDFCYLLADTTFSTKIFDMGVCDAD